MADAEAARRELEQKIRAHQGVPGTVPVEEPPRVCFGQVRSVSNPVQTHNEVQIACGRTPRRQDAMTTDQDLVTCPQCKDVLAGLAHVRVAQPLVAPPPAGVPVGVGSYRQLLDSMNQEQLEGKVADLEGELAAVRVLLEAAQARAKKIDKGAGG